VQRIQRFICLVILIPALSALPARAAEVIPPSPDPHHIVDQAGVLSPGTLAGVDRELADFERASSNQLVVAIYPTMQSQDDIAAYAQRVATAWKIGQKNHNNGVLLLVFVRDHKLTIQVGYGLEGALPDATAKMIIEKEITPRFKANDYDGGIRAGVDAIIAATKHEYKGSGRVDGAAHTISSFWIYLGIFVLLSIVGSISQRRHGTVYSSGGSSFWWTLLWMLSSSGGGSSRGGGSSGGGGFSGGGGRFGGGGASGSW